MLSLNSRILLRLPSSTLLIPSRSPSSSSSIASSSLESLVLLALSRKNCRLYSSSATFATSSISSSFTNYCLRDRLSHQQQRRRQQQQRQQRNFPSSFIVNRRMSSSSSKQEFQFQAWRVDEKQSAEEDNDDKKPTYVGTEQTLSSASLPNDDDNNSVLIKVTHSSLNYKDALSASGNKGVTKTYPHTPGIDAAGYIVTNNDTTTKGESVLVTGYDLGMNTDGGYGEYIRVPKEWIVTPNPFEGDPVAARTAMIYGTAGLTAALSVHKLIDSGKADPSDGKVVVTGATGSVGSVAVELLSKLGFDVVAVSGKSNMADKLYELGAKEVVGREVLETNKRPLLKPQFAHGIDTVGGGPLVELLKQIRNGGSVTCCGNAAGNKFGHEENNPTVFPFILRGVSLLGIDSVAIPIEYKREIWNKLATTWKCPVTESSAIDIGRHQLDECLKSMLRGKSSGKIVLRHDFTEESSGSSNHNSKL